MKTKFINAKIFTNDTVDIVDGIIVVCDNVIEYVGADTDIFADQIIDCKGNLLMPGFINGYTHTIFSNIDIDNVSNDIELNNEYDKCATLNSNDVYTTACKRYNEMIKCGITTVVDLNKDYSATLKAMTDTGIRGVVGIGYDNSNNLEGIIEELKDTNKVVYAHNMYELSEDDFANYLHTCKKYNLPFVTNASETLFEVGECDNEYGMTPIELLENYGMFDIPCVVAGASQVDKEEMQILSNYNVNVVTVPSKDLITGHGVAPIVAYNKQNINVCIGLDAISKNADIFREMNLLVSLQKGIMHKIDAIDNMYAIYASTINSAKSYNLNKIGVLQKGNFADIILIQIGDICKISDMIHYTNPSHVLLTMIDGKILYKNM